jgi:hypothetical protein
MVDDACPATRRWGSAMKTYMLMLLISMILGLSYQANSNKTSMTDRS